MADHTIRIDVDGSGAKRGARVVKRSLDDIDNSADRAQRGVAGLKAKLQSFGAGAASLVRQISLVATAMGGVATAAVIRATIEQEKAVRQLEQAVKSTGGVAGFTADQLKGMASRLQQVTTFGDESIIAMQSVLLTFTNIRETLPQTTEAVLNLSTRMGTDLNSAALQLGKALNDPVANLGALGRAGIQFSDDQQAVIKSLAEGGRMADAQRLILAELETQFGGSARAARDTFGGALAGVKNAFGDLLEGQGGLNDAKQSLNELEELLTDPQTVAGAQAFVSSLIGGFSVLSRLVVGTRDVIASLAEAMAAFFVGSDDPIQRVNDQIDELRGKLQGGRGASAGGFGVGGMMVMDPEQRAEIEAQIAALEKQKTALEELFASAGNAADANRDLATTTVNVNVTTSAAATTTQQVAQASTEAATAAVAEAEAVGRLAIARDEELSAKRALADLMDSAFTVIEEQFGRGISTPGISEILGIEQAREDLRALGNDFEGVGDIFLQGAQRIQAALNNNLLSPAERGSNALLAGFQTLEQGMQAAGRESESLRTAMQAMHVVTGVQAIANAMANGDPYTAVARAAAVAAVLAQIGISTGFGGGSTAGALDTSASGFATSGTVLGDPEAASESIVNAIDQLEQVSTVGLRYTQQMAASLSNIERALGGVAGEFARVAQARGVQQLDIGGQFGAVTASTQLRGGDLADAVLASYGFATNLGADTNNSRIANDIQRTFEGIGDSIQAAVTTLGGDGERAAALLAKQISALLADGITIEEQDDIADAVNGLFSSIADGAAGIADAVLVDIDLARYQAVGEGLAETLVRVASGFEVVSTELGRVGQSLDGIDVDASENLIALLGGIEDFTSAHADYVDAIYTDAEKLALQQTDLARAFDVLGVAIPESDAAFRALVESVDLSTAAGQALYAGLLEIAPLFGEVMDELDSQAIEDAAAAERELERAREDAARQTEELARITRAAYDFDTALGLNDGLRPLRQALGELGLSFVDLESAAQAGQQGLQEFFAGISAEGRATLLPFVQDILGLIPESTAQDGGAAEQARRGQIDALREQIRALEGLRDVVADLRSFVRDERKVSLDPRVSLERQQQEFFRLANAARGGDLDAAARLTGSARSVIDLALQTAGSQFEFERIRATVLGGVGGVADVLEAQTTELDVLQQQLSVLEQIRDAVGGGQINAASPPPGQPGSRPSSGIPMVGGLGGAGRFVPPNGLTPNEFAQLIELGVDPFDPNAFVRAGLTVGRFAGLPGFADGGAFRGGARVVGERGPELEFTGPSRIFSHADSRNMLAGANKDVVRAIERLERRVDLLTSAAVQTTKNTGKNTKLLERWDGDGLPAERSVA